MGFLRILYLKRKFEKISSMSAEQVEVIQQENIRKTLEYAVISCPFYSALYEGRGSENLLKGGFQSVPMTDKEAIMANFAGVVTSPSLQIEEIERHITEERVGKRYHGKYVIIHTSGSSGKIGIFVYDSEAWDTLKALVLARCTNFGLKIPRKRLAFVGVVDGHFAGVTLASDTPRIMVAYTHVSVNEPVANMVERLNRFKPDDLRGYPSGLAILASEKLAGRLKITPNNIVSSAEPLDEKVRKIIQEAFGIQPYNFYAASESIGIAQDCSEHFGLHVFNDQYVVELVDEKGQLVPPGKPGNIVLTNLYNRSQPLIRYKMNDVAVYSDEPCRCGSPFPVLKNIGGRREETIWVEDGRGGHDVLHPILFVEFFVPGLRRLQVTQTERNTLRIAVVLHGNPEEIVPRIERRMNEILSGKGLQGVVKFEVDIVDSIPPDPKTGKTKTVISKVGPPRGI